MADTLGDLMSDGLASPLGDVIAAVGRGVADAQAALDAASLKATLAVYETEGDAGAALLREIGYRPTFYVLPETTCEVQLSMRVGGSGGADGSAGSLPGAGRTYVTPVDAGFQQRYGFLAQGAAKLTFKVVPVPPPSALDEARPVPDLVGRDAVAAATALGTLGLVAATVTGDGKAIPPEKREGLVVAAQDVPAPRLVPIGGTVTLTLKKP
ncbi:PASTA domain-containing protein [Sandaracinobacteroides saxicola]|uniref:PASTA domain-containing protein n=1 Tax=Sandaracinobacteroides saxicola TaxID=2759707 RepID=A0A7G5IHL5_9SPHN|nr:PASTA domain-containing protein [Sandaracinobacteroides saxicola]QMW22857.1 PASTA domain-containing protein [Sandaracinobacteroides saxicola]